MKLRVTLLGGFRALRGDEVLAVPGARLQGLFVRLALAGGRSVEPGVLVEAIWAQDPPAAPGHALQALVSRLRRALGVAGDVTQVAGGYRLDVDDVDVLRFEQLAVTGRDRLRAGDPGAAADALGEAVALWGDRPGIEPAVVAAVAPAAATRLALVSIEVVADLADAELSLGRTGVAADRLTALLAEQTGHERAAALLMDALAVQGRQAEALAVYERVREALADALGADPGAALSERHLRLLRGTAVPAATRSSLPASLSSFIGRDDDVARIGALLAAGRLVTVLGPGGAGKTRLAVEAARRHHDGAFLIDLAPVTEPAKIGAAVLAGLGLRNATMFEARGDDLDILVEQLAGRDSLLLVDNCEHLIDAVAHLVAALLSRCPGVRVLATSREPLAIDGETLVPLGPLPLPEPGDSVERARQAASVRLFIERAAAVRPGFDVDREALTDVTTVVRGLDGMPLALELAAARLRTLSLPELAAGLSDRFGLLTTGSRAALPRHRTLRAVIAWSWDLLSAQERTVAERISVLPGGVTTASATAVCAGTTGIPDLLAGLVDRSLLQLAPEPGRYRMLETLREYGIDRLAASGELDAVRDLAADHFTDLIAGHDPELRGPGQVAAIRIIGAEYDNTLAALRRRCDTGDSPGAVTLALSLTWYWQMLGRSGDAAYWLGEALAVPGGGPSPERDCAHAIRLLKSTETYPGTPVGEPLAAVAGRLLAYPDLPGLYGVLAAFTLAFLSAETAAPLALLDRAAGGDDGWLAGLAHMFRAELAENAGQLATMHADVDAALARFGQAGDRWGQATVLPLRAQLRQYDDDLDGALADLSAARSLAGEFGTPSLNDEVFRDLRWIDLHLRRGDHAPAVALLDAVRDRVRSAGSADMQALIAARAAGIRLRLGDLARARELLDDAERGLHDDTFLSGHVQALAGSVRVLLCQALGDPDGAEKALVAAYTAAEETRDLPIQSLVAVSAAALADGHGRHHDAAVLLGTAARLRGAHDRNDPQIRELTRRARAALGEIAFATAYGSGFSTEPSAAARRPRPALRG
ncbi:BTAD domain-containing putative transcriptional regulator [Winogradskya consettensis]|uniref:SARP family transcriptional regulator n=1 Tax=Winogradskya consettensis TaxID=113560 RepID=A0A919VLA8_9ACTN|nr:BTAD domain-containing putative transcriptional regulator [Actinoplanes consettensis]GIM70389.1 SARP family transcriptional regulator [Actinoplanes consettensis]